MKNILYYFSIITLITIFNQQVIKSQLPDTITKNHYYNVEIFDSDLKNLYKTWRLTGISGGFSGDGYQEDFDELKIDSIGIFKVYRNDSLFIYGKITIDEYDNRPLLIFVPDTITGNIRFSDMKKHVNFYGNLLYLNAPCCDRYNYHFTPGYAGTVNTTIPKLNDLRIFSNSENYLAIHTDNSDICSVKIYSLNGKLLYSTISEGRDAYFDLSSFMKGVYIVTVRSNDFVRTEKFIKL